MNQYFIATFIEYFHWCYLLLYKHSIATNTLLITVMTHHLLLATQLINYILRTIILNDLNQNSNIGTKECN